MEKKGIDRRGFLQKSTLGLGAGAVGLSSPSEAISETTERKDNRMPSEVWVASSPIYKTLKQMGRSGLTVNGGVKVRRVPRFWSATRRTFTPPFTMKSDGGYFQLIYYLGEAIKEQIIDPRPDWDCFRIYDEDYSLPSPSELTPCTKDNVTNTWSTPFGMVVWSTHGWEIGASYVMDVDHTALLDDNYPAFTFQVSCLNAHPETANNLVYSLLKHGGICTIGSSRVSWDGGNTCE